MKRTYTDVDNSPSETTELETINDLPDLSRDCPYLDTVDRNVLDFDFEKVCSVSLTKNNTYACLVCGKYYQGRSKKTPAFTHSVEENHHVFINLTTRKVFCLPDDYEVIDPTLSDIKGMVDPQLTDEELSKLDNELIIERTLDGKPLTCGIMGLNNINLTDYFNSVIQALAHCSDFRDFFLRSENYTVDGVAPPSELVNRVGILIRKMWYPHNWRSHVSPHELLQEVSTRSKKKYRIGQRGDPLEFFIWLINTLHQDFLAAASKYALTKGNKMEKKKKTKKSIISTLFQGSLRIKSEKQSKESKEMTMENNVESRTIPFFYLSLDLPPTPLFKDELEKFSIPEYTIYSLLSKYDGVSSHFVPVANETRTYLITKLPKYLIIFVNRFTKNYWYKEKNKSIVNFPVKNLDMTPYVEKPEKEKSCLYNLVANIQHDGKPDEGTFKVYVHHKANKEWYQVQDMIIETLTQQRLLEGTLYLSAEAYLQIYESKPFNYLGGMARYVKEALEYFGFSTTVGKDLFFDRRRYRPAGQTGPKPNLVQNYPTKDEIVSDQTYSTMKRKFQKASINVRDQRVNRDPRLDFRNKYNHYYTSIAKVPTTRRVYWKQLSEEEEAKL